MRQLRCYLVCLVVATPGLADCTLTNTMHTPLNDLGPGKYQGLTGGLYPNGRNQRPLSHLAAGIQIATEQVAPRDAAGNVNTNIGKVVMISIGMSNTTQEYATGSKEGGGTNGTFKTRADADLAKNPFLSIVDCAQSGEDATQWTNVNATTWVVANQRLAAAGVTSNQVQVAWMKQAFANPSAYGAFPAHAQALQRMLEQIARNAKFHFPNLALLYISSRTRAYTNGIAGLNPEPFAYEAGWATQWTIQDQLNGTNGLNFDPRAGPVLAPWLSWGPYLWADGTTPRSDGFVWLCSDVRQDDFTHPGSNGVSKVGRELLAFFKTDPTTKPWFLKPTPTPPTLSISADASNGLTPLAVNFSASASSAFGPVTNFVWTFDDGDFADGQNPAKIFPAPGVYQVRLTAEDTAGNAASTSLTVNVSAPFDIQAIQIHNSDIQIAWPATGGIGYVVQASDGAAGRYSNNFTDISPPIIAPGTQPLVTNYLDVGALTNWPARYYRIKLVP